MPDFRTILVSLNQYDVRYVLIGGFAMTLHGSAHVTFDIDVCLERTRENLKKAAEALRPFNPRLRGVPKELPFTWDFQVLWSTTTLTLSTDASDLDILMEPAGAPLFDTLFERTTVVDWDGISVPTASLDDLISMKRAANRPRDQLHLMELEAIRKLRDDELTG